MPFGFARNRDLAGVYTEQTREAIDPTVITIFPPDQSLAPGDVAVIQDGRFVTNGSVGARGLNPVTAPETPTAAWSYGTSGSVTIGPSVQVPNPVPGRAPLLKATLKLARDRSVVASFGKGREQRVVDANQFGAALMQMWFERRLRTDEVVVWSARSTTGGTVVVSSEGSNEIELSADSSLVGGLGITLDGLSVGVHFGNQTKATYRVSDPGVTFTTSVRAFWLPPDVRARIDRFGFSDDRDSVRAAAAEETPTALNADDYAALLSAPELSEEG